MGEQELGGVQNKDKCLPCHRGMHLTCDTILKKDPSACSCTHQLGEDVGTAQEVATIVLTGGNNASGPDETPDESSGKRPVRVRRTKRDDALKDQQSTGRKRAAKLYPLDPTADCEWAGRVDCGGGSSPIVGCGGLSGVPVGKQKARHHGPDKNTLNNEPGNVHRICHRCHNTWHAKNDPDYDPNKPLKD